ncbi:hypothetical protein [Virgisporangium aurantiacum]|uniref:Uncharacterized protein n=1 Tax=Virgisporangium aurantiacum TaxID=175570 RepID=A0A8J3Z8E3_9ACTN|nr:hypothetical protein [Virgisporangium aurantiacum]GIJ58952.1 hypothetical protein Vau01_064680 [Virgisporangium aurantiacum]
MNVIEFGGNAKLIANRNPRNDARTPPMTCADADVEILSAIVHNDHICARSRSPFDVNIVFASGKTG